MKVARHARPEVRVAPPLCALAALALGCQGFVGELPQRPRSDRGSDDAPGGGGFAVSRLTERQFARSARDLLGLDETPEVDLGGDAINAGGYAVGALVSTVELDRIAEAADELARSGVDTVLRDLGCEGADAGFVTDPCANRFVDRYARRAYRRPPTEEERADLLALYAELRSDPELSYDFRDAVRVLLSALLQAPPFLYHLERAEPMAPRPGADFVPLDDYELASRLSYFLWGSAPDEALLQAAADGRLREPDVLRAEAERLLADPRAADAIDDFSRQWLELTSFEETVKAPGLFPAFDESLRASMLAETQTFVRHVILEGDGRVDTLLTADFSFLDADLAALYGVEGVDGDDLRRVSLAGTPRRGLLSHASLLAAGANAVETSPILRGKRIRERLLCHTVPPPPNDVDTEIPPGDESTTMRERLQSHTTEPRCASCHQLMDPLGFPFEAYDPIGRHRELEAGRPVDTSGFVVGLGAIDAVVDVADATELSEVLASSPEVEACVSRQLVRYALARRETRGEEEELDALAADFTAGGADIRALLLDIVLTRAFRTRPASP